MAGKSKRRKMKPSQKLALGSMGIGVMIACGVYLLWPGFYWWVYLLIALLIGGFFYDTLLDYAAKEKIIDDE